MIVAEIQMNPDVRAKLLDPFELEAGNLDHQRVDVSVRRLDQRSAEVAADEHALAGRLENVADHRGDRAFAVGAGDADDRRPHEAARQLQLADHRDAALRRASRSRIESRGIPGLVTTRSTPLSHAALFGAEMNLARAEVALRLEVGFPVRQ